MPDNKIIQFFGKVVNQVNLGKPKPIKIKYKLAITKNVIKDANFEIKDIDEIVEECIKFQMDEFPEARIDKHGGFFYNMRNKNGVTGGGKKYSKITLRV